MGMKLSARRHYIRPKGGIDLFPFISMGIILIIITLILSSTHQIRTTSIILPKYNPFHSDKKEISDKDYANPVYLLLEIGKDGYHLGKLVGGKQRLQEIPKTNCFCVVSKDCLNAVHPACVNDRCLDGGNEIQCYHHRILYNSLVQLKKKYPDETIIHVLPDPDIEYMDVLTAMDLARYKLTEEMFETESEFRSASKKRVMKSVTGEDSFFPLNWMMSHEFLFPYVILAVNKTTS